MGATINDSINLWVDAAKHLSTACSPQADSPVVYRNDPYSESGRVVFVPSPPTEEEVPEGFGPQPILPGTLHWELHQHVSFIPYPTREFVIESRPPPTNLDCMTRLFLGQLPYAITDMQLDWLCMTFAGATVYYPERITKRDDNRGGLKVPTGCIHAYCDNEALEYFVHYMHKRILIDDTGVWYAQNPAEMEVLVNYCRRMKQNRRCRVQNRPYDTVVVQTATSTYIPAALFPSTRRN